MSHFAYCLNRSFGLKKKVAQVVQIGGRGGGNLDKIQKNSNFFSWDRPLEWYYENQGNEDNQGTQKITSGIIKQCKWFKL